MFFKNTIKIIITSLILSQAVYAVPNTNTPIKLAFVNNTDQTGNAFVYVAGELDKGPVVEKNEGYL